MCAVEAIAAHGDVSDPDTAVCCRDESVQQLSKSEANSNVRMSKFACTHTHIPVPYINIHSISACVIFN